ncbi:hypothetical protein J27TS7_22210 [Paenibacillus dendritiformis]|uniref:hypothetical protein n=1 Tax=Paenibacillus dendritiformis TaxID=130049 RepID=UPI001B1E11BF|nr:hypothetical protein [Paenibacillus dendritiformis]GIO72707.1 hypothetical protein J27TS7_22210 [Paenibacillus dendritiformis]
MSPHPEELLRIYIILGPFASNRSETGEIPADLQDSLFGEAVHIELLYLRSIFAYRIDVSEEIVQFRLPNRVCEFINSIILHKNAGDATPPALPILIISLHPFR